MNKYRHFTFLLLSLVTVMAGLLFLLYNQLGSVTDQHRAAYNRLVASVAGADKQDEAGHSTQQRTGLRKDLFFNKNGHRQHLKVLGEFSQLHLEKNEKGVELIEKIRGVRCSLEEIATSDEKESLRSVYAVEAAKARYAYRRERLVAEDVKVDRFLARPGGLQETFDIVKPLLSGTAKKVWFLHQERALDLEAEQFQASLNPTSASRLQTAPASSEVERPGGLVTVSADRAHFAEQWITLQGHAAVRHPLGYCKAKRMVLVLDQSAAQPLPDRVQMEGEVQMLFREMGELTCTRADLTLEPIASGKGYLVDRMVAEEQVLIKRDGAWTLSADRAIYKREAPADNPQPFAGLINLYAFQNHVCELKDEAGNLVRAPHITLDTSERLITLFQPQGKLQADVGEVQAEHLIRIYHRQFDGKEVFHKLETEGKSSIIYHDQANQLTHSLFCDGQVNIDHEKMETRMVSCADGSRPVYFKDALGEMYADKVLIKYQLLQGRVAPQQISLSGNVRICNRFASEKSPSRAPTSGGTCLQYALADRVDFYPQSHQIDFKAATGKRVILYDKENDLEVSAPGVKLLRAHGSGKESVQGIGDVRFRLTADEFERLRQQFTTEEMNR